MNRIRPLLALALLSLTPLIHADEPACKLSQIKVPDGYTVELAASTPLVKHPLMACFDEVGRLYVAANAGRNLRREDLEKELPNYVQRLEDTDGDGVFDKSVVFADRLTFPQGCLWYRGSLYVASSGAIWKLTDTDDDGQADERIKLVGDFGYTGNAADVHGPFLGREGRIWWCQGRHGHEFRDAHGNVTSRGKAARIFNCLPDGTDVRTWCTGGMDNPVELVFTPEGDVLGTVNLMYARPRGDCLVHWQWGGVYPREDFVDSLGGEFYRTGELLREVHNFGHVAVSGLCRYESTVFGDDAEGDLFITQFNTGKIIRTKLKRSGATYEVASNADFLTSECEDFHPTDVLEDADGSLLVIDTGGWFRIGCPESQVAKPGVHGAIYRVRKKGVEPMKDPRGLNIAWEKLEVDEVVELLGDDRPAVQERAIGLLASIPEIKWNFLPGRFFFRDRNPTPREARNFLWAIARNRTKNGLQACAWFAHRKLGQSVDLAVVAAYASLPPPEKGFSAYPSGDDDPTGFWAWQEAKGIGITQNHSPAFRVVGARLLANMQPAHAVTALAAALKADSNDSRSPDKIDRLVRHAFVYALIRLNDRDALIEARNSHNPTMQEMASVALEQLRRDLTSVANDDTLAIPPPMNGQPLNEIKKQFLRYTEPLVEDGNVERGRAVYANKKKANCAACHRIGTEGVRTGPDLTTIGDRRSRLDLLEAVVFPSASFVRGFEPYMVVTIGGKVHAGTIIGESAETITLAIDPDAEGANGKLEIRRDEIDTIKATNVSIMPANLHEQLSEQELADLLAYLQSLRIEKTLID